MRSDVFNIDCMEYMRTLPDNYFQLAIADPPYGIGATSANFMRKGKQTGKSLAMSGMSYTAKMWDCKAPDQKFFDELLRVCENVILWGANHYISRVPYDSSCWIVWDKQTGENLYADCELAWTTFPTAVRKFTFMWKGMFQGNMANKEERIHPTQKPVALYAWILHNYAKSGGGIFDPMMGSQSSRIAAYKMGFDYVGCELDKEYFDKGNERFERECHHTVTAPNGKKLVQLTMFGM